MNKEWQLRRIDQLILDIKLHKIAKEIKQLKERLDLLVKKKKAYVN